MKQINRQLLKHFPADCIHEENFNWKLAAQNYWRNFNRASKKPKNFIQQIEFIASYHLIPGNYPKIIKEYLSHFNIKAKVCPFYISSLKYNCQTQISTLKYLDNRLSTQAEIPQTLEIEIAKQNEIVQQMIANIKNVLSSYVIVNK